MALYQCNCGQWYTDPKELNDLLNTITESNPYASAITVCPSCGEKTIVGGEYDLTYGDGIPGILMFGCRYDEEQAKGLPEYTARELIETDETGTGFSTWHDGRTLNLKVKGE